MFTMEWFANVQSHIDSWLVDAHLQDMCILRDAVDQEKSENPGDGKLKNNN